MHQPRCHTKFGIAAAAVSYGGFACYYRVHFSDKSNQLTKLLTKLNSL